MAGPGRPGEDRGAPLLIGVCGGTGSGKTTISRLLVDMLAPLSVVVVAQDDYYRDSARIAGFNPATYDFDHPDARDFDLLSDHLTALADGQTVAVPRYCFKTHARLRETFLLEPHDVVVLEGTHLFSDARLRGRLNLRVFVDCAVDIRLLRRLVRDTEERGRSLRGAAAQWLGTVRGGHDAWTEPLKAHADMVVCGGTALEPGPSGGPEAAARLVADAIERLEAGHPLARG
jgi:uridine kinase